MSPSSPLCLHLSDWIHPYVTVTKSDFTTCPLSIIALYILWAIAIALILYSIYINAKPIYVRYAHFVETVSNAPSTKQRLTYIHHNKGFLSCVVFFTFAFPAILLQGIISFALPERRIGVDVLQSVLFAIFGISFHVAQYIVESPLIKTSLIDSDLFRPVVHMFTWSSHVWIVLQIVLAVLPIVCATISTTTTTTQFVLMECYFGGKIVISLWKVAALTYVRYGVDKIITKNQNVLPLTDRAISALKIKVEEFVTLRISQGCSAVFNLVMVCMAMPEAFAYYWPIMAAIQSMFWIARYPQMHAFDLKQTKAQEIAALVHGMKLKKQASVYFGRLDPDKPSMETIVTVKEIPVGKDTMVKLIWGKPAALWAARVCTSPIALAIVAPISCAIYIGCILVVVGVVDKWVSWLLFASQALLLTPLALSLASLKILRRLLLLRSFSVRFAILLLWAGSLMDVFALDERCAIAFNFVTSTAILFLGDSIVEEGKTAYFEMLLGLCGSLPFVMLAITQFDLIGERRDSVWTLYWGQNPETGATVGYQWSSMQAVRDFGTATVLFCIHDLYHVGRRRGVRFFLHLTAPIRVRVVKLETQTGNVATTAAAVAISAALASDNVTSPVIAAKKNREVKNAMKEIGLTGKLAALTDMSMGGAWTGNATQPQWDFEDEEEMDEDKTTTTPKEETVSVLEEVDAWDDFTRRRGRVESNFTARLRIVSGRLGFRDSAGRRHRVTAATPVIEQTDDAKIGTNDKQVVTPTLAWIDMIVLYEKDTVVARLFGPERGEKYFEWMGQPVIRIAIVWITMIPLGIFACGVLPGFMSPPWTLFMLTFIVPLCRSFSMKSIPIMKLLTHRRDFVGEAFSTFVVLVAFAWQLDWDERMTALVMFFGIWLDLRLQDAKAVFFHSRTHGDRLNGIPRYLYHVGNFLTALFFFAIPCLLLIGAANKTNTGRSLQLFGSSSSIYNQSLADMPEHVYYTDQPRGTFAAIRPYQFISDFLTMFSFKLVVDVLQDRWRGRTSIVNMEHLRGPVIPKFCDFDDDELVTVVRADSLDDDDDEPQLVNVVHRVPSKQDMMAEASRKHYARSQSTDEPTSRIINDEELLPGSPTRTLNKTPSMLEMSVEERHGNTRLTRQNSGSKINW